MPKQTAAPTVPTLPQQVSPEARQAREFQLSLARTEYNYMQSYLEGVPMSADLPGAEKFSLDFEAQVVKVFIPLAENFKSAVGALLERELKADLPTDALRSRSGLREAHQGIQPAAPGPRRARPARLLREPGGVAEGL